MRILNRTRNTVIAESAVTATGFFARVKGLIGKKAMPAGSALVISPCTSIHTFWMNFAIDAIFYDKAGRTVRLIRGLAPGRISGLCLRAKGVIEVPAGTLSLVRVEPGDELEFEE